MKQDTNLGWTSYKFKPAPMDSENTCKATCSANPKCDFYTFIDSITSPKPNCWCGEYKAPDSQPPLTLLDSVSEVTLKFKKGEIHSGGFIVEVGMPN